MTIQALVVYPFQPDNSISVWLKSLSGLSMFNAVYVLGISDDMESNSCPRRVEDEISFPSLLESRRML